MEDSVSSLILASTVLNPISGEILFSLVILIILLGISAFVSGSEVAFFALKPQHYNLLKESKHSSDKTILRLTRKPEKLLATILIVNNLVNVAIVILSSFITASIFDFSNNPTLGFIVQIVLITFVLLLFGEIIPKVYASRYPMAFAKLTCRPLSGLMYIFHPLSTQLTRTSSIIQKRLTKKKQQVSIDELTDALELTDKEVSMDDKILKGIVNFPNIGVSEIMRPRMDVVTVRISDNFNKVIETIRQSGYSRIPVIEETFDNIKGILYVKDLLPHTHKSDSFRWQSLIRPPFYVPESKKIDDLLKDFQTKKIHMAILVDEYGGTSGIVTMEDVLEQIIGEINDEFDNEAPLCLQLSENTYQFEAKISLIDFCKKFDLEEDYFDDKKGDAETIAGFFLEQKEEIPQKKERLEYKDFLFEIKSVDNRRIKQMIVTFNQK